MLEDIIYKLSGLLVNKDKAAHAIKGLTTEAKIAQQESKSVLVLDPTAECQQEQTNIARPVVRERRADEVAALRSML